MEQIVSNRISKFESAIKFLRVSIFVLIVPCLYGVWNFIKTGRLDDISGLLFILIGILIPIFYTLRSNKEMILYGSKQILYKLPLDGLIVTFFISIGFEIFIVIVTSQMGGDNSLWAIVWVFWALGYMLGISFLAFLMGLSLLMIYKKILPGKNF